jgi:hypothetical protein
LGRRTVRPFGLATNSWPRSLRVWADSPDFSLTSWVPELQTMPMRISLGRTRGTDVRPIYICTSVCDTPPGAADGSAVVSTPATRFVTILDTNAGPAPRCNPNYLSTSKCANDYLMASSGAVGLDQPYSTFPTISHHIMEEGRPPLKAVLP